MMWCDGCSMKAKSLQFLRGIKICRVGARCSTQWENLLCELNLVLGFDRIRAFVELIEVIGQSPLVSNL